MTVNLITLTEPRSGAAEAYRTLRTNIMFSSVEKPITTLLVTSAAASEDKSITVANLAVTLAQSGARTILVDADLRRPAQHTIWGIDNSRGLSAMMLDDSTLASPPLIATSVDNLSVLPSGALPPVPSDVLSSQRMTEIIVVLKARASFILFDAPPVLAATDATILGTKVDAVVLVARAGAARRDQLARAAQMLKRVNVRFLGVVLTNAPREMKAY
ncbi:MAG: capsular biosynthesis protein [Phototrophicales bacterium]|nr:MAG: capsular biosynthesis protein [Phototrophicales bacterium]